MQVQVTTTGSARDVARPRSSLSPRLYHIMICAKASDLAARRCQGALRPQASRCTDAVLSLGPWVKLDPGNSSIHSFLALACTVWILFWLCAGAIRWSHNRRPRPNKWSFGLDSSAPDPFSNRTDTYLALQWPMSTFRSSYLYTQPRRATNGVYTNIIHRILTLLLLI